MAVLSKVTTGGNGRTWFQTGGAASQFLYGGCYGMGDVTIPTGDRTQIFCPSPTRPNEWDVVGTIKGVPGNPTVSLEAPLDLVNYLLTIDCPFTVQQRFQECATPEDPDAWESMLHFKGAEITQRGVTGLNAREPGTNATILVTANLVFKEMSFVKRMEFVNIAVFVGTGDIQAVSFCDDPSCPGNCGAGSAGCQVGYLVTMGIAAGEQIYKTEDAGANWSAITSPFTSIYDDIVDVACKGDTVIIVNGTTAGRVARSQDGGDTWQVITLPDSEIADAVFMLDVSRVWVAGANGYIWFSEDGGRTFATQEDGTATTEDLRDIFFFDQDHGWAVGTTGAILYTNDGGDTWQSATSGTANTLNTVHFITRFIGYAAGASGTIVKSVDGGATWAAKTWFGAATDTINAITSCEETFVFFGGTTTAIAGFVYQSVDGGEDADLLDISVDGVNDLFCCAPDKLFIAGDNGVLVKGA